MRIDIPADAPIRGGLTMQEKWHGEDRGLIACWERGRELAVEKPDMSAAAKRGELVPLPWKGGVEATLKAGKKIGTHFYYAMWLGLRGDPLAMDTALPVAHRCTRFGVVVTFTGDFNIYANA